VYVCGPLYLLGGPSRKGSMHSKAMYRQKSFFSPQKDLAYPHKKCLGMLSTSDMRGTYLSGVHDFEGMTLKVYDFEGGMVCGVSMVCGVRWWAKWAKCDCCAISHHTFRWWAKCDCSAISIPRHLFSLMLDSKLYVCVCVYVCVHVSQIVHVRVRLRVHV